jgi:ATP-binding cassette, subfamily B, bacterial
VNQAETTSKHSTFRVLRNAFTLLWQADRTQLTLAMVTVVVQGFLPAIAAYIAKLIVDHIAAARGPTNELWWLLGFEAITVLATGIISRLTERSRFILGERVQMLLRIRVLVHASNLDLEFFETPSNFDALSKAQRELGFRPVMLVMSLLSMIQGAVSLFSFAAIIAVIYPLLLLPILLSVIPALLLSRQSSFMMFDLFDHLTPEGRRTAYLEMIGTEKNFAKEMRLYGLHQWILNRVTSYLDFIMQKRITTDRIKIQREILGEAFSTLVSYGALGFVTFLAATNAISLGTFTLFIGAIASVRGNLMMLVNQLGDVLENSLLFADLDRFFAFKSNLHQPKIPTEIPKAFETGFKLEQLHFSYPGSSAPIFSGLDLTLQAGQATALVGVNGAGKTTLVKLLTRLYDPTAGRITLNDTDIREFDREGYRKMFAVLLQDFAQYQMSARDNITLAQGDSSQIPVDIQNPSGLEQTAINAGALELIQGLPNGWNTLLGRLFDEQGQDLSGGQWQRIALARALYRQAPILILDEPSAALDAEAEAELFERYREFAKGKLSLLITHRFNTVRFADRIIVLEHGRVVEDGSHTELMRVRGRYFEMFTAQASAYEIPA